MPEWRPRSCTARDPARLRRLRLVRAQPADPGPAPFDLGLGQINHADLVRYRRPHVDIMETTSTMAGVPRRDVYWITDKGELHEWYLGEWRQEYLIKSVADYRIMQRAWTDVEALVLDKPFLHSEQAVGDSGITVGQLDGTPFHIIQIDYAGLARFSYDIVERQPALLDLLDLMTDVKLGEFRSSGFACSSDRACGRICRSRRWGHGCFGVTWSPSIGRFSRFWMAPTSGSMCTTTVDWRSSSTTSAGCRSMGWIR